jgi:nicotinate phosphoribosyltransferase
MIIRSKYENDVYQFNISYALMMKFPNMKVRFKFKNRRAGEKFDQKFIEDINLEFAKLRMLKGTKEDKLRAAKKMWWLPLWYHDWFQNADIYRPEAIKVWLDENSEFQCIMEDYGWRGVFWETGAVLPIFSELRNRTYGYIMSESAKSEAIDLLREQINLSNEHHLPFSEFGLRRRFSAVWQDQVDDIIKKEAKYCVGNSSVYQAFRLDQPAVGTMAHSIFMAYNAIYGYREGNYKCVKDWMDVFNGHSGILLGDTIGQDTFLKCMTTLYMKASTGYRHDSGPWETATTKYINRLKELKVDPLQKSIVYSNSINMFDLDDIANNVRGRVGSVSGGIGGALTNNIPSMKLANPNIVMKLDAIKFDDNSPWVPCVKVPDEPGKEMGDPKEVEYCKYVTGRL